MPLIEIESRDSSASLSSRRLRVANSQTETLPTSRQTAGTLVLGESLAPVQQADGKSTLKLESSLSSTDRNVSQKLVTTCVSSSGNTIVIVRETQIFIYKVDGKRLFSALPTYVGHFSDVGNGTWRSGRYGPQLNNHGILLQNTSNCRFGVASTTDDILVTGAAGSEWIAFFAISADMKPGKPIYKWENVVMDERFKGWTVQRILINHQGNEVAVLFDTSKSKTLKEIWQFYSVVKNDSAVSVDSTTSASSVSGDRMDGVVIQKRGEPLEMGSYNTKLPFLKTKAARYSHQDDMIVSCTSHSGGTSLVTILANDGQDAWRVRGRRTISFTLDAWDAGCLGLTGVDL
jgi:hypothetical protein